MKHSHNQTKSSRASGNKGFPEPANLIETEYAVFWRAMCHKYLPYGHCYQRFQQNRALSEYIDQRYRRCCKFHNGQEVVLTDTRFGRIIGTIKNVQSCWSFFELNIKVSQGNLSGQVVKVGQYVTEIRLAQKQPVAPTLF